MSRRSSARGAAALEFALVVPVILLLIFGVIQYGYYYWARNTAAAAAREATRLMVVNTTWACARDWATRQAEGSAVGATPPSVSIDVATDTVIAEGTLVTVTVAFDSLHIGFLPVPDGGRIEESVQGRVQYAPTVQSGGAVPQPCPPEYR